MGVYSRRQLCPRKKSEYSDELIELLFDAIINDTRPLKVILLTNPDFPHIITFYRWLRDDPDLQARYLEVKKVQSHVLIDEIISIADDPANCEPAIHQWAKLRIDTRKWLATRLLPKIYGDKQHEEQTSSSDTLTKIQSLVADLNKTNTSDI